MVIPNINRAVVVGTNTMNKTEILDMRIAPEANIYSADIAFVEYITVFTRVYGTDYTISTVLQHAVHDIYCVDSAIINNAAIVNV